MLNQNAVGGIIGKLSFDNNEPLAQAVLESGLDAVLHHDDGERGFYSAPGIALKSSVWRVGSTERDDVHAVADSSITNAGHLRAQLEQLTHRFRGVGDAELIAHAYAEWGPRCVGRFAGPFACAIWDDRTRTLILARDHMGIRPLYFALLPGRGLIFASELRALLRDPGVSRAWCPDAIDAYLALGYVPAPLTPYQRVSKLEAAQLLAVDGRRLHTETFWELAPARSDREPARKQSRTERPAEELMAAIDGCLRSVVGRPQSDGRPEGILYSGGTASSLLLAAAPRPAGRAVTVAVEHDPTELARSHGAAAYLGCERELETAMAPLPILASELVEHIEEPIADPSAIVEFAILAAARRHTDCAITAHGASILWSGCARRPVRPVWSSLHRHAIYTRSFGWQVRDVNPLARHHELYAACEIDDRLARAMYVDARTFLPDGALAAAGRAARATGMQLRYPFLDRALVQLAIDTPPALGHRGQIGMYALRRLLQQKLPAALMPPARQRTAHLWLRSALAALVPSMLFAPRFDNRGIVSRPAVVRLWDEYRGGRRDHAQRLWSLLMLELWFREFIDGDRAEQPLEYAVVKIA